uniref:(northern house mosquito) hypothetical protein n=1 Tax=Culex pipiens TaxID=7175 RepID=A0A8D8C6W0_CULPI
MVDQHQIVVVRQRRLRPTIRPGMWSPTGPQRPRIATGTHDAAALQVLLLLLGQITIGNVPVQSRVREGLLLLLGGRGRGQTLLGGGPHRTLPVDAGNVRF